nr:MAG TPA: hypothetical protein [Caudoviricetes sp.]
MAFLVENITKTSSPNYGIFPVTVYEKQVKER